MKKTVVVTGGSRGIGAGIAKTFAARGWDVAPTYAGNRQAADGVVNEIKSSGGSASAIRCDIRSEDNIRNLFKILDERGAKLSALINNAGVTGPKMRLEALSADVLRESFGCAPMPLRIAPVWFSPLREGVRV